MSPASYQTAPPRNVWAPHVRKKEYYAVQGIQAINFFPLTPKPHFLHNIDPPNNPPKLQFWTISRLINAFTRPKLQFRRE